MPHNYKRPRAAFKHEIQLDHRDFFALHTLLEELRKDGALESAEEVAAADKVRAIYGKMITAHTRRAV